jgi:hypothetical protein
LLVITVEDRDEIEAVIIVERESTLPTRCTLLPATPAMSSLGLMIAISRGARGSFVRYQRS